MALVLVQEDGGGDYVTLAAAIAANETDIEIQETWNNAEDTHITIDDASTTIECTGSAKHPGWVDRGSETHYRLRPTGAGHVFTLSAVTPVLDSLDIRRTDAAGGASDECIRQDTATITVKNSILWMDADDTTESSADGIYVGHQVDGRTCNLENTIFYNFMRAGVNIETAESAQERTYTLHINSCTFYECGIQDGTYGACINFYVGTGVGDDYTQTLVINIFNSIVCANTANGQSVRKSGTSAFYTITADIHDSMDNDGHLDDWDAGLSNCLQNVTIKDTGDPPGGGADEVAFVETAKDTEDLRLLSNANNDAQDYHTNASGAGLNIPATDLIGTSRPQNTNYDVGAFEIVAAAVVELNPNACGHTHAGAQPGIKVNFLCAPNTGTHAHSAGTVATPVQWLLDIANAAHAHAAEAVTGIRQVFPMPNSCSHAHAVTQPGFLANFLCNPNNGGHAHTAGTVATLIQWLLDSSNAVHAHSAGTVTALRQLFLDPANASHAHSATQVVTAIQWLLDPANASHAHASAAVNVLVQWLFDPDNATHSHSATSPSISLFLIPDDLRLVTVSAESRFIDVDAESRIITIPAEDRFIEVQ